MTEVRDDIIFTGGTNTDDDPRYLPPGDYVRSDNLLSVTSTSGHGGAQETLLGNKDVFSFLPDGVNTLIGEGKDIENNAIVLCYHNSEGNHTIVRHYIAPEDTEYIAKSPVFNFLKENKVLDVNVIGDLCYINDRSNPPRKINMEKGRWGCDSRPKSFSFRFYFGNENDVEATTYTLSMDGAFPPPFSVIPDTVIVFGFISGRSKLAQLCTDIADALNANAAFAGNGFVATANNEWVDVVSNVYYPLFYDGIFSPSASVLSTTAYARAVSQNYYDSISEQTLDVLKWPPWKEPSFEFITKEDRELNLVKGTKFQFAQRYVYDDYETSVYSPASVIAIDPMVSGNEMLNTPRNAIVIDYSDEGRLFDNPTLIRGVEIIARNGNTLSYQVIARLNQFEITGKFVFYNDTGYIPVGANESLRPFDNVPKVAGSQTLVENTLLYAGSKEGFDKVPIDATLDVSYRSADLNTGKISGDIYIKKWGTNTNVPIDSVGDNKYFGQVEIPAGSFTVYLAGTRFKALAVYDADTDIHHYDIDNVPNGSYVLRIASHLCKDGATWGAYYDTDRADLGYQNTSSFVRSYDGTVGVREAVITIDGNAEILGDFIVDDPTTLDGIGGYYSMVQGYLIDSLDYDPNPFATATMRNGQRMEYIDVSSAAGAAYQKQYYIQDIIPGVGSVLNIRLNGLSTGYATPISGTFKLAVPAGFSFFPYNGTFVVTGVDGGGYLIGNYTANVFPTPPFPVGNAPYLENTVSDTVSMPVATTGTDHNGFFYFKLEGTAACAWNEPNIILALAMGFETRYGVAVKPINNMLFVGNITPGEGACFSGTGALSFLFISYTNAHSRSAPSVIMPNTSTTIHETGRTHFEGHIFDQNGFPVSGVAVAITNCGRYSITGDSGAFSIIVYADDLDTGELARNNDFLIISFNPGTDLQVNPAFIGDTINAFSIKPFGDPPPVPSYNNTSPYEQDYDLVLFFASGLTVLKHSARYKYAIQYENRGNQHGTVNTNEALVVSIPSYRAGLDSNGIPVISWAIYHKPPIDATHYQWLRTLNQSYAKCLQVFIDEDAKYYVSPNWKTPGTTSDFDDPGLTLIGISLKTIDNSHKVNEKSILAYTFDQGDRIRLIKKANDDFYNTVIDGEVVAYSPDSFVLWVKWNEDFNENIENGAFIELYNPVKQGLYDIFFAVGETYDIIDPHTEERRHAGPVTDQDDPVPDTPATGVFNNGDTYFRRRDMYRYTEAVLNQVYSGMVEDASISDNIVNSNDYSIGLVNTFDMNAREFYDRTVMRWSLPFIQNTQTNGLSSFLSENKDDQLLVNDGKVVKLVSKGYIVKAFQEYLISSVYIGRRVIIAADGSETITTTDGFVGTVDPSRQRIGCIHPESVHEVDSYIYFLDAINGYFCRLADNGSTEISANKMYRYFQNKSKRAVQLGSKARCYTSFDTDRGVCLVCFVDENDVPDESFNETLMFYEKDNRWKGYIDLYQQVDGDRFFVQYFSRIGNQIFSQVNGSLYRHNDPTVDFNEFYRTQHAPSVTVVAAASPKEVKVYNGLWQEGNKKWFAPNQGDIRVFPTDTYRSGMESRILLNKVKSKEGKLYVAFLNDMLTPNFADPVDALMNGRRLRGNYMQIRLEADNSDPSVQAVLFSLSVISEYSELS